jgi:hypothetical protein
LANRKWALARFGLVLALVSPLLTACGNKEERARQAEVDSIAAAKARGETDLNNPEMGSKVLITLTADSIAQSHTVIPPGQVTFAVQNRDKTPHVFQITGATGNWKTMPIPPDGAVLMAMIIQAGEYDLFCPDTAGGREVCGAPKKISTH